MIALTRSLLKIKKNVDVILVELDNAIKQVDVFENAVSELTAKTPRKPRTKGAGKVRKGSATDKVLSLIEKNPEGISTEEIIEKTGLEKRSAYGVLTRAKKEGKIKSPKRGVYVKVPE